MGAYLARRVGAVVWVVFGLSLLAFGLVRLVPGDTVTVMLGPRYSEDAAASLRERLGLNRSLPVQYAVWTKDVLRGDFGTTTTGTPVRAELARALSVTAELALLTLILAVLFGVPLGAIAGASAGRWPDRVVSLLSLGGLAVPGFWIGTLLVLVFALGVGWLPSGGFVTIPADPAANLRHLILPAISLAVPIAAVLVRTTRAQVAGVLAQPYVRTARSKGLHRRTVFFRHVLRNALPGVLTVLGVQTGWLLGGSAVIEALFSIPGLGRLALDALERRDYATLQGVILLAGVVFAVVNLAVDVAHLRADPRVAEEARASG